MNETRNRDKIISNLLDAQRRQLLDGIHGRLGDLGTIPDKYDCAITTACSFLDFIVVNSVEAGERCIEHLREYKLGQAKFICMDKMATQYKLLREKPF